MINSVKQCEMRMANMPYSQIKYIRLMLMQHSNGVCCQINLTVKQRH